MRGMWIFLWLMLALKIPIVALYLIVRWAVRQTPEEVGGAEGGIGPRARPLHPRSPLRRAPRRGPHGEPASPPPVRVRTAAFGRLLPAGAPSAGAGRSKRSA
ncbi:MAG: hypothetical protein KGJ43_07055 [Acidobacteriota bacterium]|nr:hypothetical protein [Acidobacteriota bacterium]